jgi:hypothetical protein
LAYPSMHCDGAPTANTNRRPLALHNKRRKYEQLATYRHVALLYHGDSHLRRAGRGRSWAGEIGGSPIGCLRQPTRRDPSRWPPAKQGVEMGRVRVADEWWGWGAPRSELLGGVGERPDQSCAEEISVGGARLEYTAVGSRHGRRSSCWGISSGYVFSFLKPALAFPCRHERRSSGWEVRRTPSPAPSRRLPPPLARRRRPGRRHGRIGECCLG